MCVCVCVCLCAGVGICGVVCVCVKKISEQSEARFITLGDHHPE